MCCSCAPRWPRSVRATARARSRSANGSTLRSTSTTTGPTGSVRVRLLNALTSAQALNFVVDGQVASTGVAFGSASPYVSVSAGSHRLQAQASGTGTTLLDFTQDLSASGAFSLIPAPGLSSFGALFIPDDPAPATGQVKLRLVHVAAAPGPVSVYVTSPTGDLASATPVVPTLAFGAASPYVMVTPGTFRADFKVIDKVTVPNQPARTDVSLVVEAGKAGVERA